MKKVILVVSYGDDTHKNHFETIANKSGFQTILFDAGGFPTGNEEISIDFFNPNSLFVSVFGKNIDPNEIAGVWWRRPRGKNKEEKTAIEQYSSLEGEVLVRSLKDFLPNINWVSDPEATRTACRKPVQLLVARKLGIKIPDTCLGNSSKMVIEFIKRLGNKKIILKPIGTSFIDLSKEGQ
ncbi:MAG: hypothetical protein WC827_04880 [Candidatus Paceibacterota bacterium]|jgi:hypothetical protein